MLHRSRITCLALLAALAGCASATSTTDPIVPVWGRWETSLTAAGPVDPDQVVEVTLTAPGGRTRVVDAFWDGGAVWRIRFMPDEPGRWRFRTSAPGASGLDGQTGSFVARPGQPGSNPFHRHGAVRVSTDGRHLAHADGTPFFWLADTGWNGALKSTPGDWGTYLADRVAKRFSAIQFVTTQWRTADTNPEGQVAYTGFRKIRIEPAFFRRIDERITAINDAGLLAAPVLLWALGDSSYTPGKLPESEAIKLARYLVARYGAHHVVWFLGGDDNYSGANGERWRRIGRAVFNRPERAPVTLHPQGMQWHFDAFAQEPWLDFLIYQSGHGDDANTLAWIHSGPPSQKWRLPPPRPVINSEPPYEAHVAYQSGKPHSDYTVRRATYWSLLNAPTAGVSYGAHGVWSWETSPAVPLRHERSGVAQPWNVAMRLAGSEQMKHLADLFTSLDWWRLRPAQEILQFQPGAQDPARFVAAARYDTGEVAVLYLPVGGQVVLRPELVRSSSRATWFDPRDGSTRSAVVGAAGTLRAPDSRDWVLVLRR